jgi:hypothetical protein
MPAVIAGHRQYRARTFISNYLPGNKKNAVPFFVGFPGFYKNLVCSYGGDTRLIQRFYLRGNLAVSLAAE